jgi:hypothetical protein
LGCGILRGLGLGAVMITVSTHAPTNRLRLLAWRARQERYSRELAEAAGVRSGGRQGAACGCASPRSSGRGAFYSAVTETLGGIGLCLALAAVLTAADWLPDVFAAKQPECRQQWTPDARYVRHCDFHDGKGFVEDE